MANENETGKRETLADIEVELRDLSRHEKLSVGANPSEPQPTVNGMPICIYFADLADRIKAAEKREKAEAEADALAVGGVVEAERQRVVVSKTETPLVGNAAAMREALVDALNKVNDAYDILSRPCVTLEEVRQACREARGIIISALSAPARNCDIPFYQCTTERRISDSVWRKFKKQNPEAYFDAFGLLHCIDWLLATAAERKGDENGR